MATSAKQEAEALLNDLDSFSVASTPAQSGQGAATKFQSVPRTEAIEAIEFLDEITKSSEAHPKAKLLAPSPARPASRATERVSLSNVKSKSSETSSPPAAASTSTPRTSAELSSSGTWGWGSVWSSASAAIQQAKTVVDEGVKNLPNVPQPEQTRQWREGFIDYVKSAQLDKIGKDLKTVSLSTLTDILNVVAPPIGKHEVIQVWLSHDLEGYEGVETLVYRALARILEQVEGGDLVVNKGNESRPKSDEQSTKRELNSVDGFDTAFKLAKANVDHLIQPIGDKVPETSSESTIQNPTVYSTVYLRIQPFTSPSVFPTPITPDGTPQAEISRRQLQFLLHLRDPSHSLESTIVTQSLPASWMNLWDEHDWVEDQLAEVLRLGVEVLGQEYVVARMGWAAPSREEEDDDAFEKVESQDKS